MSYQDYFAKTPAGLESVLADELRELGAKEIKQGIRGVQFKGDKELLYKSNFCLRTAISILKPLFSFSVSTHEKLYDRIFSFEWESIFSVNQTFSINTTTFHEELNHSQYISLKVKDAIVDRFRNKQNNRPSVDIKNPDIKIQVHIDKSAATISLDSSGEPLFKRGYRTSTGPAPLNEVLAAGLIMLSGWNASKPFYDPMCGSGTFCIEAAMIGLSVPPGKFRKRFGFMEWDDFDKDLWDRITGSQKTNLSNKSLHIYASDISSMAIQAAEKNAENAGLSNHINLSRANFLKIKPAHENGILIMNPPYGVRLETRQLGDLYESIGSHLKHQFAGYEAWIIIPEKELLYKIGLKPSKKIDIYNGALPCKFAKFELYQGSKKKRIKS